MEMINTSQTTEIESAHQASETYLSDTERRNPHRLVEVHPLLTSIPEVTDPEEARSLRGDIRERGFDYPVIVDEYNRIIDGRRRVKVAQELDLEEIPVVVRKEYEAASIILGSFVLRRAITKSAQAFYAVPLMQASIEAARQRRIDINRTGGKDLSALSALRSKGLEEIAADLGISPRLFKYAISAHKFLEERPHLRSQVDVQLLKEDKGLASLERWFGAEISAEEQGRINGAYRSGPLSLIEKWHATTLTRFEKWETLSDQERGSALDKVPEQVAKMPNDLLTAYDRAIRTAIRNGGIS